MKEKDRLEDLHVVTMTMQKTGLKLVL